MEKQIAVLIDGDNISAKYAEYIKQEAMEYGNVRIFRLYGSVNSQTVKAWYKVMPLQGIMPVPLFLPLLLLYRSDPGS